MSSVNHVFKFGATALAVLVLSACGGSGGGSSSNNVATPANNQTQQNQSNLIHLLLTIQHSLISKRVAEQVPHLWLLIVTAFLFVV